MSVTASITGNVTLTDSVTGTVPLSKALSSLSFTGLASEFSQSALISNSGTTIPIPNTTANFIYIKNVAPSNTITVAWTPSGGSSNTVVLLEAGGFIAFCNPATGGGVTAMTLTASANNTPVEFIIAG